MANLNHYDEIFRARDLDIITREEARQLLRIDDKSDAVQRLKAAVRQLEQADDASATHCSICKAGTSMRADAARTNIVHLARELFYEKPQGSVSPLEQARKAVS